MAITRCGYEGCKNPVRKGEVRCYLHKDLPAESSGPVAPSSDYLASSRLALAEVGHDLDELSHPPNIFIDPDASAAELVSGATPISPELSGPVIRATDALARRFDPSIPARADERLDTEFDRFQRFLVDEGVPAERITTLELRGCSRRLPSGRVQYDPDLSHLLTVLDLGTPGEVAVDPFYSRFAPVRRPSESVDGQMASGSTPYGDVPYVAPVGAYLYSEILSWDSHRELSRVVPGSFLDTEWRVDPDEDWH